MTRINIVTHDEVTGEPTLQGWFDPDRAARFEQDTEWDGHNHIGVITGSQWIYEYLYRTAGGRWVLWHDARSYHNGQEEYAFVTDEQARDWLLRSRINDDAVTKYFGELEDERGPGRPEVGKPINVRLGADLLARVDERAKAEGKTRADMLRDLVSQAIG